jgi:hypothetical protein
MTRMGSKTMVGSNVERARYRVTRYLGVDQHGQPSRPVAGYTRPMNDLHSIIHGALVEIGVERPSPDWERDPRAAHLLVSLPRFAGHLKLRPPLGMDPDDWIQDLRITLVVRSHSLRSRWDPARGKQTPASWAAQIMRSRTKNIYRNERLRLSRLGPADLAGIESYGGGAVWR